jgi:hypothetical protein
MRREAELMVQVIFHAPRGVDEKRRLTASLTTIYLLP